MPQNAGDIMIHDPVCVQEGTTLDEALHKMRGGKTKFNAVLIVNKRGDLRGLLEGSELINAHAHSERLQDETVDNHMMAAPPRVTESEALDEVERIMVAYRLNHLPVVNNLTPVGIISLGDVLTALANADS
jgi:signal-transduction protein with cAMP-binding, CBS, and nucleotidyltransferase domain